MRAFIPSSVNNKLVLVAFVICLLPIISKSQTNGLDVKIPYDQMIQDNRHYNEELNNAYTTRYNKFKKDYLNALELNEMKDSPSRLSNSGSYNVVFTNGSNVFDKIEVFLLNNKIISLTSPDGKVVSPKSCSEVKNFRCVVTMPNNQQYEVIFTDLFK